MSSSLTWVPTTEFERVLDEVTDEQERARAFATLCRINTLYMITRAGSGHLGSSFSAADIVSWLLLSELREPLSGHGDVYFSSKGHDVPGWYAAMIGLGALPEHLVHRLRRIDGLPGHPDVRTPHVAFNTGSLGMGISKAKGMILANRLSGRNPRVYVLTGDGELQEGQIWESLAGAARYGMGELTVVVDHNKLQSDTWVRDVSDLGDLSAKFAAFGWRVLRCDGHDYGQLRATFAKRHRRHPNEPAVIIADTVKGAGTSALAATDTMSDGKRFYDFHSGAPDRRTYTRARDELVAAANELLRTHGLRSLSVHTDESDSPVSVIGPRLPQVYGQALADRAATDDRIIALDADLLRDTGLLPFAERFGDRLVECGIAEQDMVSTAGGLAARGMVPFVHSFSCFLHARPNEQIYNNASEGRRVVYVGSLAGVLPAGPGHSHQAVRDISAVGAVPGLVVLEPASPADVVDAVDFCRTSDSSVYLRLVSTPCPERIAALRHGLPKLGHGTTVREGGRVVAVGAGPVVLDQLLGAADLLAAAGIDLTVVNLPWHNRVHPRWLSHLAASADHLFVVENHYTRGGQADLLARRLLELDLPTTPRFRGIGLTELPRCGDAGETLTAHGISATALAAEIAADVCAEPTAHIAVPPRTADINPEPAVGRTAA